MEVGGYVYVIQAGVFFKIGRTKNIKSRLSQMKTSNPHELRVVGLKVVDSPDIEEFLLHREYEHHRVRGEWFKFSFKQVLELLSKHDFENLEPINNEDIDNSLDCVVERYVSHIECLKHGYENRIRIARDEAKREGAKRTKEMVINALKLSMRSL